MISADAWHYAQHVLCIRLDTLGDVLMTTPAIRALKESCPGRRITLLTSTRGAAVGPLVPEINDVLVYDAPWMKATALRADSRPEYEMAERMRTVGFDGAVIFTVYSQNPLPAALLCFLADIPLRLAYCRDNPYQLLTHWVPDPEPDRCLRHEVQRQLDLVATIGCRTHNERLSLRIPEDSHDRVLSILYDLDVAIEQPWIVIHPGATAPSRRYPPEGFAEAARRLVLDAGCQVLFTGTKEEQSLIESIQAMMGAPSHSLVGKLDLRELAALIQLAPLLIANNTGPAHIAAALGTPVVDLYALTNPQHAPWKVPHRVLFHDVPCKYCYKSVCPEEHHHCLRLVTPDAIVHATEELLCETQAGRSQSCRDVLQYAPTISHSRRITNDAARDPSTTMLSTEEFSA